MTTDSAIPADAGEPAPAPRLESLLDSTRAVLAAFLLIGAVALAAAWSTVHARQPQELAEWRDSARSHVVLAHWLDEGYFHYAGLLNREPGKMTLVRNSTGAFMVSGFIVEKIYILAFGHYSYRLLALHNQVVTLFLGALAGLLSYRLARRFGLESLLAFSAGAGVVLVIFTNPECLQLYWELNPQAYALLFALSYLLLELLLEDCGPDRSPRSRRLLFAQAGAVFLMTAMEMIFALCFAASLAAAIVLLRRGGSFRRFLLVVVLPLVAAVAVYEVQIKIATARYPDVPTIGSGMMFRTGLDGDAQYYGDHLDIAFGRQMARINWAQNQKYFFRWPTVFILGVVSFVAVLIAFVRGRAPRLALEALATLTGAWVLYAAVFSQAVKIHPWLYDLLLFTPLAIALFALAPSLLESLTGRTGAIVLVIVFSAVWYSLFQMRIYSLRYPMLPPPVTGAASTE